MALRGTLFVLVAALCLPPAAGAAAGDVDTSWGSSGKFTLDLGPNPSGIYAAAKQADGKIVVAGFADHASSAPFDADFMVARLTADGALDTSFNATGPKPGVQTTPVSGTNDDFGYAVAIGPNGEIYVVGSTDPAGGDVSDIAVVRYTSTGALDSSFSGDGVQVVPGASIENGNGVAVQADGKPIVVGGSSGGDFQIMRLDPVTGALDTSYNAAGVTPGLQEISFGSFIADSATAIALQADGKAVVAGTADANSTSADIALVRLKTDGTLDTAGFGAGTGKVQTSLPNGESVFGLALDGDKIVVAGEVLATPSGGGATHEFMVARYLTDGSPDVFFGGSGFVSTAFVAGDGTHYAQGTSVLVEDGKVIVNGYAFNCPGVGCADFAVARYTDDGQLDPAFGDGGKRTYQVGGENDYAWAAVPGSSILFGLVDLGGTAHGGGLKVATTGSSAGGGGTTPPPPPKAADLVIHAAPGLFFTKESEEIVITAITQLTVPIEPPEPGDSGFTGFATWFSGEYAEIAVVVSNSGPDKAESYKVDVAAPAGLKKPLTYRGYIRKLDYKSFDLVAQPPPPLARYEAVTLIYGATLGGAGNVNVTATVSDVVPADPKPENDSAVTTVKVSGRPSYSNVGFAPAGAGGDIKGTASAKAALAARAGAAATGGVEIALLQRRGKKCSWLTGSSGKMQKPSATRCNKGVFLRATGKRRWHYHVRKTPPAGKYAVLVRPRASSKAKAQREFGASLHNLFRIRIR